MNSKLTKYNLLDEMDRMFEEHFRTSFPWLDLSKMFQIDRTQDLAEDKDCWKMRLEIPGFAPEEIAVEIKDETLTVCGKKEQKSEFGRQQQSFTRSIALGRDMDLEKVEAQVKDGVLILTVPKKEDCKSLPRKVEVKR